MARTPHRSAPAASSDAAARPSSTDDTADFDPVTLRHRHDGWTPARQITFIRALADCGCVEEAARRVGMSRETAYSLRRRPEAVSFRQAWDLALDHAVQRLSDAAFSRAINGTATPVFYQGQQIGERRRYDEKLTMFLLRYRDPQRYGRWQDDRVAARGVPDGAASLFAEALTRLGEDAQALAAGRTPPRRPPLQTMYVEGLDDEEDRRHADARATYAETMRREMMLRSGRRGDLDEEPSPDMV